MATAPAFQLYASDLLIDTLEWDIDEVGIYTRLLMAQWANGDLPADIERLARIAGCDQKRMKKAWEIVSKKFITNDAGRLINLRLEQTRIKQEEYRESQIKSGQYGANKRWGKDSETNSDPISDPISDPNGENIALHSSSSLKEKNINILKEKIVFIDDHFQTIPAALMNKWREVAPGINITDEIKKAELWLLAHPEKRRSRYGAFLSTWMVKAQDNFIKYGGNNGNGSRNIKTGFATTQQREADAETDRLSREWYDLQAKKTSAVHPA